MGIDSVRIIGLAVVPEDGTVILAMLLLSVAVDQSSAWLRRVMR